MIEKAYDIVIIGSGAGGGTVARELSALCREGLLIAVLEQGPKLGEFEYTGREIDMAGRLFVDSGGFATADGSMTIAMGRSYGGSTVVYTGTSTLMRRAVLDDWGVGGIEYDDLMARCHKYMKDNNVHLLESENINDNNRLFREACETLGYAVEQFPVNVKGCRGSGLCNMGCPNGAKQGTHRVQLPQAELNGVEVITNCRVERIEQRAAIATVNARDFGFDSAWQPGRYRISAKIIVIAAGAVHSPALLLRSKLAVALPALGITSPPTRP